MAGARPQVLDRALRLAGLTGHIDDGIPLLAVELAEGVEAVAIRPHESGAAGHHARFAAGEAGHLVPAVDGLSDEFGTEPSGAAEHEDAHGP